MTNRTDVAPRRDIVARWCGLAEQRLDYLTQLFETGRWRRYFSEQDFLENLQEARDAVQTWRGLLTSKARADNRPVDLSWIGRRSSIPQATRDVPVEPATAPEIAPQLAALAAAPPVSVAPAIAAPGPVFALDPIEVPERSALDSTLALTRDIVAMAERYPLLRNAFQPTDNN